MMKILIGLNLMLSNLFLSSCSELTFEDKVCYAVINSVSDKMKQQGLVLIGSGVKIPNKIRGLDAHYVMVGNYNIEQARILFVNCVEEMIHEANSKESMKPFMNSYPFTNENIEIILGFREANGNEIHTPFVSSVLNVNNTVFYSTIDPETNESVRMHSEPYDEGVRIVRENCSFE